MNKIELKDLTAKEIVPGYRAKFVHSENMTCAFWEITAGASLPEHSHIHEQISNVTEGSFELFINGESHILGPDSVIVIPGNTPHFGKAITDCKITDIFYPIRAEYR
ncbi:MAG: cupin [Ignavibacteria bacterium GWF2_33_9]|nr:MAG: cupin [Ignavibacteria bacterium GWF2_33_9]